MQQLYFLAPGRLEWRDVPEPRLSGPESALVRPIAASTCDLDILLVRGLTPFEGPFALGHECVAEIVELGEAVRGLHRGQRVIVSWHLSCGGCEYCRSGRPNACSQHPRGATYGINTGGEHGGMFSDLLLVPHAQAMLVPLPDGLSAVDAASAADNLTFGYELTVPFLREYPGAPVLVLGGCGSIPLYAVAYARAAGACEVDYIDSDPQRLAIAERLGARVIEGLPRRSARRYPLVVDGGIGGATLPFGLRALAPEGRCNCVGAHFCDVTIPLLGMYANGSTLYTGRGRGLPYIEDALAFVRDGRVQPALIRSEVLPFESADRALAAGPLKPVFVRPGV